MSDYIHLHNHTHYSLQDAACTVPDLIQATVENDQHAIALTDHGVMFGASEFSKKAQKAGIKPIIGVEAYVNFEGSRFDKGTAGGGRKKSRHYNHLVLLAKNKTGYKNLVKLTTIGYTEGFYYKPRIDVELLTQMSEGLVCTSACAAGPISAPLINGDYEKAKKNALLLKAIFGDDFYLEIQDHHLDIDKPILEGVPRLSAELGIKMIATNDIHYINKDHSIAHNILLLLGDKTGNANYLDLRYRTDEIYFRSTQEMKDLFIDYKGAIENTLEIDEKITFVPEFEGFHYPNFPIPPESKANNLDEYFTLLAREGLHERFGKMNKEIEDRFNYEIDVITKMGYSGYFLIVQDFINAAKDKGIPVGPGRGSAAGSLVAYALRITNVNPLDYDLLFERFLNPARKSMPDIDVDFADDQRTDVIEYTKNKYGEDSVCQIITFNRLSSKAVLRDVARVLKIPISTVNSITKWIPSKFGRVFTIKQALEEVPELKWVNESDDPKIKDLIRYGQILEGMNRNSSKHAAGVVITPGPVSDFVPLAKAGGEGDLVTQYNMKELDDAGLLKMDFLGLRTLTIIRDTLTLIKQTRGIDLEMDDIPLDDQETYDLFARGQTTAVFQFESGAMREYLKNLVPTSIKDLSAMNALYRPGPMEFIDDFIARKHGKKEIEYLHPKLEPILKETYGIIIYQEQVIIIANVIAGMTLAEADILRRAMGKKDLEAMKEQKKKFIAGAVKNGIKESIADEIFTVIDKFANYGFNKSHAVAYSVVAYQTAYLKAHFLPEFLAANMTNEYGNTDKVTMLLDDSRRLKVPVLPPDVNNPSVFFNVKDGKIIFGMSAIKNVGKNAVEEIKKKFSELGRNFTSIYDLCANVDTRLVNKRVLEGLVLAGAFDSCNGNRAQNLEVIEDALSFGSKAQEAIASQANSLFGGVEEGFEIEEPPLPPVERWTDKETLAREREVLGFYLSDHPLRKFDMEWRSLASVHLGEPETFRDENNVTAIGVITAMRTKIDKSGNKMAFFRLDDFTGSCECIMFSKVYVDCTEFIQEEETVLVKGRPESSGDAIKLHVDEAYRIEEAADLFAKTVYITMNEGMHDATHVKKIKELIDGNEGDKQLVVHVNNNGYNRNFIVEQKINLADNLIDKMGKILGEENVKFNSNQIF